ncbi:uncharacterized protein LOC105186656 [Harpegnathos saltator]|uniref:uncharacterized protein LOC105186656 n=1 Tax=Harpegnathos saltator TaxID=610380 RepID=UPI00058F10D4|nr:uncharacterized protein LOC105186656 [Harpegnathos saltator]XP_011145314.1 uncharacterized protein LOC105186656 [Harpegnathos saltator]
MEYIWMILIFASMPWIMVSAKLIDDDSMQCDSGEWYFRTIQQQNETNVTIYFKKGPYQPLSYIHFTIDNKNHTKLETWGKDIKCDKGNAKIEDEEACLTAERMATRGNEEQSICHQCHEELLYGKKLFECRICMKNEFIGDIPDADKSDATGTDINKV